MDKFGEFIDSTDAAVEKKEELGEKVDSLDNHIHKIIEERDIYIMEKLNTLQGDAATKVKTDLDAQANHKLDMMNQAQAQLEDTEDLLTDKLKQLDAAIDERNTALSGIEQLGVDAQIDVSSAMAEVNAEIDEMNEQRDKIVHNLRTRSRSSGKPIVI